ncbi:MAG: efflux RND transporter permease subunit [Ignavibacteriales bacterium]|nr:efflux RND transporter permease subunit [Ignavibacteriales bacterium]
MKKIFYIFLTRPITTAMFFFSVVVVGIVSVLNLPIELSPNVEYPRLSVSVAWPGVSPEAVEAHLTSPIEAELSTIQGVKKISSTSSEGSAQISLEFHPSVDIEFARVEINEKLSSIKNNLPVGVLSPRVSQYIPKDLQNLQGFLTYSISSNRSSNDVRKYLTENVVMRLKNVDGVSEVEIRGGSDRLIEIEIDYDKSKSLGILNEEINNAISETEKIIPAGKLERNNNQVFVKINNEVVKPSLIGEQVVKILPNGNSIRIKDIARIIDDYEEQRSYYRINGKETVTLIIDKELGANTLSVAKSADEKLKVLSKEFPSDFIITKEVDRSKDISKDLDELYKDGLFSILIIFLVVLVIFRRIRYSLIILSSIFFSLLASFSLFYLFNLTLNIITFSCFVLGFGFIVDNSIVVLDYLDRHYEGRGERHLTVLVKEIFFPLFTSTITITAVFIPLIFLTGELQLYFQQFALGIGFTLFASLIVSFTVVPLLYLKTFHKRKVKEKNSEGWLYKIYRKIVSQIIKRKKLSIAFLILVIGFPVWLIPNRIETPVIGEAYNSIFDSETYQDIKPYVNYALGGVLNLFFNHVSRGELWKYGEETYIYVRLDLPNGNRIERINKLCKDLENEILAYKESFKTIIANVLDEETATLRIEFTLEQSNSAFPYMLKNYVTAYATRLGGVDSYVYGFGPGFSNAGGGSSSMFNVEVKGFNFERVRSLAESFRDIIKRNPRVDNIDIDKSMSYWSPETYELVGKIDRSQLAAYGISVQELFAIIAKNTSGNMNYSRFKILNESVNYRVKFSNYNDMQLDELKNLIVNEKGNERLKVSDLVTFEERKVLSSINRIDQQYVRYVSFEFKGPYKYGNKFLESSVASIKVPEGYSLKQSDYSYLFAQEDEINIWKVLGASLFIIFMVTAGFFESFKKPLIIITAVPYAIVGAIFLFWLTDNNIERGAYAGMLLLVGLSVSNSIVLVSYLSKNVIMSSEELISAAKNRLRAITSTTLTTFAALLPFILSDRATFWKNLSISIAGGIFISYIYISLFLLLIYKLVVLRKRKIWRK